MSKELERIVAKLYDIIDPGRHNPLWFQVKIREATTEALKQAQEQGVREERQSILSESAERFHPYCGEPSCYEKLKDIVDLSTSA